MNSTDLELLELPSCLCKCAQLAPVVVNKIQCSDDSSLLDPLLVAQLCASRLSISAKKMLQVKDEEWQKNVIRIIHAEWCVAKSDVDNVDCIDQKDPNVFEQLVLNQLKEELKRLQERTQYLSKLTKEKQIRQQNVELVDRSAIYLKQCFWVSRSISGHHFQLKSEFPDSDTNILYQMIYGKPTRNVKGTQYAATRFEVFAISPHGKRFAMHNTVDVKFGDRIPECDRQVHFYAYAKQSRGRHGWVHMGRDTSHYLLQSHISHYSTFPQYKSIVQFGYLALPFLQQVDRGLPLSLLFEIICYAAPFLNDDHSVIDYDMSRFTPDLRLPNFLQFQRYLWLNSSETISVDVNETNVAQVNCVSSDLYWDCSKPLLPLLNANSRRKNTKRAFEPIKKCLKNSVKFDASEYTPACWWRLWQWNNSDSLLSLRRISTPSHLKLAFVWQREVYSSGEAALALIRPLLSQCLQASKDLFQFFCNVRPQDADIGQAEDGVWYIFPTEMDLQTVDAKIDQFLLDNKWTLQENPKELEAKAKQSASKRVKRCASRLR